MNLIIESIGRPIETDFSKTSVAHARNAVLLSKIINADIVTGEKDMHIAKDKKYNNIICSYASPYMKYKKLIHIIDDNPQAKLWWFVNDHDLEDNILLRNVIRNSNGKRTINMVCNNSRENYRGWIRRKKIKSHDDEVLGLLDDFIIEWHTLNINALIYNYTIPYKWSDKVYESVYYGTMRKHRLDDLLEYQKTGLTLSATSRTQKKFIKNGIDQCQFTDKLSWQQGHEQLRHYKFSLYIEDIHTHTHYAHMANRFYESLMCNVVTIFDKKCKENLDKSGYYIPKDLIVDSAHGYIHLVDSLRMKDDYEMVLEYNNAFKVKAEVEHAVVVDQLKRIFMKERNSFFTS